MNRFRSAAASKTSRSGLEPLKMLRLVPCHPAHSRAPVQGFNARLLRGILSLAHNAEVRMSSLIRISDFPFICVHQSACVLELKS